MPRKKPKSKPRRPVPIMLNADEKRKIKAMAKNCGQSLSGWARGVLLEVIQDE